MVENKLFVIWKGNISLEELVNKIEKFSIFKTKEVLEEIEKIIFKNN